LAADPARRAQDLDATEFAGDRRFLGPLRQPFGERVGLSLPSNQLHQGGRVQIDHNRSSRVMNEANVTLGL